LELALPEVVMAAYQAFLLGQALLLIQVLEGVVQAMVKMETDMVEVTVAPVSLSFVTQQTLTPRHQ
jgi:hypothetical protein